MTVKTIKEHINNLTLEADAVIRFGGPHSEAYLSGMQKSAFIFIPMPKSFSYRHHARARIKSQLRD